MNRRAFFLFALAAGILSSCTTSPRECDHAILFESGPGKLLLAVSRTQWEGFWGPEGYIGNQQTGYWAALEGGGPVFINPHFQDNPSTFHCVGTITLDL